MRELNLFKWLIQLGKYAGVTLESCEIRDSGPIPVFRTICGTPILEFRCDSRISFRTLQAATYIQLPLRLKRMLLGLLGVQHAAGASNGPKHEA